MPLEFTQQFSIQHFECDPFGRMSPGAMLRRVQEIAYEHCDTVGITDEVYSRTGAAFLLSRLSLVMFAMPGPGAAVTLHTRAWGPKRAVYNRVSALLDEAGAVLCEVDARWVLVDVAQRRILRGVPEGFPMPFDDEPTEEGHPMRMPKAVVLQNMGRGVATYSQCDTNHHMNNTRYADLVCDALPLPLLQAGGIRRMLLHYHAEIPLGAEYALESGMAAPDCYYFVAGSGGHKHFEASVELNK